MMTEVGNEDPQRLAQSIIAYHSKSFSLASRLLPREIRDDAVLLYAFCRHADDLVDEALPSEQPEALRQLRAELDACYSDEPLEDPVLRGFRSVIQRRDLPRIYAEELVEGMAMDVHGHNYETLDDLLIYCYRAAATVGLMMCHVMGVRDDAALKNAAHLGIAMQITNICRDVGEDWERGRRYLPRELLQAQGAALPATSFSPKNGPIAASLKPALRNTVRELLTLAERYYRSGDRGLPALERRCRVAVSTARQVYSAIGRVLAKRGFDPLRGRAYVSGAGKLLLAIKAWFTSFNVRSLPSPVRVPREKLPLEPQVFTLPRRP